MIFKRALLLLALLLALSGAARGYSLTTCPTGWWVSDWHFACVPSNAACTWGRWYIYWLVGGRIVNNVFMQDFNGTHGGSYWQNICWDESPWPTSWFGPTNVWRFDGDSYTLFSWKRETNDMSVPAGQPGFNCHCYATTDGHNWYPRAGPANGCYAWECF